MKFLIFFVLAMVLANTAPAVLGARGRMYNAKNVVSEQFPSLVRLGAENDSGTEVCSGTLIRDDCVLTAAHCVFFDGEKCKEIKVFMGSEQRWDGSESEITVKCTGKNVIVHESYDEDDTHDDISLVRIPKVKITKKIGVAPLAQQENYVSKQVNVAGWGNLNDRGKQGVLAQWSDFTVVDVKKCVEHFKKMLPSQLCIYKPQVSSCVGDSGGPAYFGKEVIGVGSLISAKGCQSNNPMVYSNVAFYKNWINKNMLT